MKFKIVVADNEYCISYGTSSLCLYLAAISVMIIAANDNNFSCQLKWHISIHGAYDIIIKILFDGSERLIWALNIDWLQNGINLVC